MLSGLLVPFLTPVPSHYTANRERCTSLMFLTAICRLQAMISGTNDLKKFISGKHKVTNALGAKLFKKAFNDQNTILSYKVTFHRRRSCKAK